MPLSSELKTKLAFLVGYLLDLFNPEDGGKIFFGTSVSIYMTARSQNPVFYDLRLQKR
jgi:hypothetical protein